ncbi:MAG TPA: 1-acyl-sn-glycerol-3-phosphate acyltransferase [Gemmatimonadaceae bacterium]
METWSVAIGAFVVACIAGAFWARRSGRRALLQFRARIDRFKLAGRKAVRQRLIADDEIAKSVRVHAALVGEAEAATWRRVDAYIHEIVPFFNVVAYYRIGYRAAKHVLNLFYKVAVEHEDEGAVRRLPRNSVVVYLMNHRSNADYVLVSYALAGQVAISYAVGEWARAFPLEHMFKAFGSYFVRRKYREPLYHAVLERYVQLITREGVTQGIFLEGGLTRDGLLKSPKIGLLDYVLGIARDPGYRSRIFIVPVAVNYDRVLEDRSLLRELAPRDGQPRSSRVSQFYEVARYLWWNAARLVMRRWRRYGRAAVTVGRPMPLEAWFESNADVFTLSKPERLARVQTLCDSVMSRIGELIPVTPVTLACAAIQSFDRDFIPRTELLERMREMQQALQALNRRVVHHEGGIDATFDRAWRMLKMRRVLAETGGGYAVLPRSRVLVSYYANSIAHLLGPFERAIKLRDALPAPLASGMS